MLKIIRYKNKLSQKELAKKIGITQSHLSRIENNKFSPQVHTLIDISKVLNICVMEIFIDYCCNSCEMNLENCKIKTINSNNIAMTIYKDNIRIQFTISKNLFNKLKSDARLESRTVNNLITKIIADHYKEA